MEEDRVLDTAQGLSKAQTLMTINSYQLPEFN